MNSIIKFLRSSEIQNNLDSAIKKLNKSPNIEGQPIVVFYYIDEDKTLIDCIFCIGIKDGKGPDTYSVISSSNTILVSKVSTVESDITEPDLINMQTAVYRNEEVGKTYWTYIDNGERKLEEIEDPDKYYLVKESTTGTLWWIGKDEIKKAHDFPTTAKFKALEDKTSKLSETVDGLLLRMLIAEEKLDLLDEFVSPIELDVKILEPTNTVIRKGEIIDVRLSISVKKGKDNVIKDCNFKLLRSWDDKAIEEEIEIDYESETAIIQCNKSETLTVFAVYNKNNEYKDDKSVSISFVEPSFSGKISYKKLEILNGQAQFPWLVGLPLLDEGVEISFYSGPNWDNTAITNILKGQLLETYEVSLSKSEMLLDKNESYTYTDEHSLNDHVFFAYPKEFGELSSIEDPGYGGNILDSFRKYSQVSLEIEGKEIPYYVYVKKQPAVNKNVVFKFNH